MAEAEPDADAASEVAESRLALAKLLALALANKGRAFHARGSDLYREELQAADPILHRR